MKHLLRKYETKHFSNIPCTEGALHGAKLRFIFHTPKACFIFCKNSLIFAKVYRSVPVFLCNNRVTGNKRQETGDKGQGTRDRGQGTRDKGQGLITFAGAHCVCRYILRCKIRYKSLCDFRYIRFANSIYFRKAKMCAYTLHPTPYTLHPTSYTLHPTQKSNRLLGCLVVI